LREKIAPDEAEDEGCGGPTGESDNEVWRDFRRNPRGWGRDPLRSFIRKWPRFLNLMVGRPLVAVSDCRPSNVK
jgi:hypothetical protein